MYSTKNNSNKTNLTFTCVRLEVIKITISMPKCHNKSYLSAYKRIIVIIYKPTADHPPPYDQENDTGAESYIFV